MKNRLFNYKYLVAHRLSAFPAVYTVISRLLTERDCYVKNSTDILIDGFPRCANTYATYTFDIAQPKKLVIAHHIHKQSQFILAGKYKIPAILLIRNPLDCISSLLVRQPKYQAATLFKGYFHMYNNLKKRNSFVVVCYISLY